MTPTYYKTVPAVSELRLWIAEISDKILPERPEWAIASYLYNKHKPDGWCSDGCLLKTYGYPASPVGWRNMVKDLTGQHVPYQQEVQRNRLQYNLEAIE